MTSGYFLDNHGLSLMTPQDLNPCTSQSYRNPLNAMAIYGATACYSEPQTIKLFAKKNHSPPGHFQLVLRRSWTGLGRQEVLR